VVGGEFIEQTAAHGAVVADVDGDDEAAVAALKTPTTFHIEYFCKHPASGFGELHA
jgi:hypothetical protein